MKTLLTLLLAAGSLMPGASIYTSQATFQTATGAAPLVLSASGHESPIPNGFFLDLSNIWVNESATFSSPVPLTAFGGYWDNLPFGVGTGFRVYADNQFIGQFGNNTLVQGFWGFSQAAEFTSIRVETNSPSFFVLQEHGTLIGIQGAAVPEPGTWALVGSGLGALIYMARRRSRVTR